MATEIPTGFHRLNNALMTGPFVKGHIYFNTATGIIYLANGTTFDDLKAFGSNISDVSYNPQTKQLKITKAGDPMIVTTVDLSIFAEKTQLGDLSDLATMAKSDLVSAINEVLAAVGAGGTGSVVTITESTPSGYAKSYTVKQGDNTVGVINIPKDMVVSSGEVETNPSGQPTGTYLVLTLANATSDKVYINVGTLVDIYTAAKNATQVQLSINSETREISATIVAGSIGTTELASKCVTGAKLADNAVDTEHIANGAVSVTKLDSALQEILQSFIRASDITTGTANGTISVDGTDVPVRGLGSMAYMSSADFVEVTQHKSDLSKLRQEVEEYSDSLHNWLTWEEA